MQQLPDASEQYVRDPMRTARAVRPWMPQLARLGYGAIGVVYLLIGLLALLQAAGAGGQVVGAGGAVCTVIDQPNGRLLLGLVAFGLLVFVTWRAAQALLDAEARGRTRSALARRTGLAPSGLSYAGLASSLRSGHCRWLRRRSDRRVRVEQDVVPAPEPGGASDERRGRAPRAEHEPLI